ncbi:MAG: MBL fold metallo-hydrolase [Hyphomicrobiaceae bacterium]
MSTDLSGTEGVVYPWSDYPAPGVAQEVADGIYWISTPVPFAGLRQVNLWLLRDGDGFTQIDCGYSWTQTRDMLETIWGSTLLGGRPVSRLIVTHYHPDHIGNCAWISQRWGDLLPHMSLAEWFAANLAVDDEYSDNLHQRAIWHRKHGLDEARQELFTKEVIVYSEGVQLPLAFKRLREDEYVKIGNDRWRVITGEGHSPEHVSLYCAERKILIAGDQILPQITTNVSTWPKEPEANTLEAFLDTCAKFLRVLDPDTLVLPSHRKPFLNVQFRLRELARHHAARLNRLLDGMGEEAAAGELLDVLFGSKLDGHQVGFAMGEAIAHLNHLVRLGRLERIILPDGRWRYRKTAVGNQPVAPHFT